MADPLEVVGKILAIPVTDIVEGDRLRRVDAAHAAARAAQMKADGQLTPIEVCRDVRTAKWLLVSGAHRLAAARQLGWSTIQAIETPNRVPDRRQRQVSENLHRRDLTPLERSAFVAEQYELLRERDGAEKLSAQAVAAKARWARDPDGDAAEDARLILGRAYGWADEVAEASGWSKGSIKRYLAIHRRLDAAVRAEIYAALVSLDLKTLSDFAGLPPERQRAIADLVGDDLTMGVADAIALLADKLPLTVAQKAQTAITGNWCRVPPDMQQETLSRFASEVRRTGWIVTYRREKSK
jgi:ParB family chromosome partitioning protein